MVKKYPEPMLLSVRFALILGVKGIVKDKKTGDAIKGASVTFEKRERHPLKTTHLGEYWKILLSGKYKLMVRLDLSVPIRAMLAN